MDRRPYILELGVPLAAYCALLVVSLLLLTHGVVHGPAATLVALAPMLPALGLCWAVMRQLRRMDEMHRRVQLEALAIAFAGTALITFSYGFLENVGYPRLTMFVIWPIMAVLWVIGLFFSHRRYA